jgi:hypothetical protein
MPQLIVVALAGAGLYAGFKWIARGVHRAVEAAERTHEELGRRTGSSAMAPKDLGALEWDAEAGVYRPTRRF